MQFPRFQRLGAFGVVAALGVLGGPALLGQCAPPPPPPPVVTVGGALPISAELVAIVNAERTSRGIAPVTVNPLLTRAAELHSAEQASLGRISHSGANGSTPGQRIRAQGYSYRTWAENVASGYTTSAAVMAGLMSSPGHRANILNPAMTEIGVAAVPRADGRIYWTMDFAAPR